MESIHLKDQIFYNTNVLPCAFLADFLFLTFVFNLLITKIVAQSVSCRSGLAISGSDFLPLFRAQLYSLCPVSLNITKCHVYPDSDVVTTQH